MLIRISQALPHKLNLLNKRHNLNIRIIQIDQIMQISIRILTSFIIDNNLDLIQVCF